jgi:ADP-ribose pyrophosphatase
MLPIGERTFHVRGVQHTHYFVKVGPVVVVLARTATGRHLLVRQYRAALDRRTLEFPAGHCLPGEEPAAAARRELEEETGYRAEAVRHLFSFHPAPGYTDEVIHAFEAWELRPTATAFDPGEDIEVEEWTAAQIDAAAADGRLMDGKTLLLWYYTLSRGSSESRRASPIT